MVDSAEREVVPEFGVPGPMSDGVTGSEGGGGRSIRVGVDILLRVFLLCGNCSFRRNKIEQSRAQ